MAADYNVEVANLKQFIKNRIVWLDSKWTSVNCPAPAGTQTISIENLVTIYPIPTSDQLHIDINDANSSQYQIVLFNMQGNVMAELNQVQRNNQLSIASFAKGIYFIHIKSTQGSLVKKVVIE